MRPDEELLMSEWALSGRAASDPTKAEAGVTPIPNGGVSSVSAANSDTWSDIGKIGLASVPPKRSDNEGETRLQRRDMRPGLVIASLILAVLMAAAIAPNRLADGDPLEGNARQAFRAPSFAHPLGTDENGRDVWTRLVYGARPSLVLGFAATVFAVVLGAAIGLFSGLSHPLVDNFVMRVADVLMAFPEYLVALVVITYCGHGTLNEIAALATASVPRFARMVRAQTQIIRRAPYVEAATALGLRGSTVIIRHVLANAIRPVLVLATIDVGLKIGAGASLSFLGFGAPPPSPEWGLMLSVGRDFLANAWWLTAFPAVAIILTVLSVTTVGRELVRRSEGRGL
ncbi:MAG TPA: ABC transporter permease [Chthoniobacterales bacterium]